MKKSMLVVVFIVMVAAWFRGEFLTVEPALEIYRQAAEGKVELIREVGDASDIGRYEELYRQKEFVLESVVLRYPDIAVYRRDGAGVMHHSNIWFHEAGDGLIQQMDGSRHKAALTAEEVEALKNMLQLPKEALQQ